MSFLRSRKAIWFLALPVLLLAGGALAYLKLHQAAPKESVSTPSPTPTVTGFKVDAKNLPSLATGHYDAWVLNSDAKTSTAIAKFNVAQDGSLAGGDGKALVNNVLPFQGTLVEGSIIEVTVEPATSKDDVPSQSVVLKGPLKADGTAQLGFDAVALTTATAKYVLATPTDDPAKNETSGLWFGMPGTKPAPLLSLPAAPAGWKYEGWVLYQSKTVSTGRFNNPQAADDFGGYNATKKPAPNFPGQDFLANAPADLGFSFPINLADGTSKALLSLEPDTAGTDPSGPTEYLLLFSADVASGLKDHVATDLTKSPGLPSATFTYSQ